MIFLSLSYSCHNVVIHPGAVDQVDSVTYDLLLIANGALTNAKDLYTQGKLPDSKDLINNAGRAYNTLREAWLGYRSTADLAKKQQYLDAINNSVPFVRKFIESLTELILKIKGEYTYGTDQSINSDSTTRYVYIE